MHVERLCAHVSELHCRVPDKPNRPPGARAFSAGNKLWRTHIMAGKHRRNGSLWHGIKDYSQVCIPVYTEEYHGALSMAGYNHLETTPSHHRPFPHKPLARHRTLTTYRAQQELKPLFLPKNTSTKKSHNKESNKTEKSHKVLAEVMRIQICFQPSKKLPRKRKLRYFALCRLPKVQ